MGGQGDRPAGGEDFRSQCDQGSLCGMGWLRATRGMIVHFPRGRGEVFHAGSCEWVAAVKRKPYAVQGTSARSARR
jgi:hypothetical protein